MFPVSIDISIYRRTRNELLFRIPKDLSGYDVYFVAKENKNIGGTKIIEKISTTPGQLTKSYTYPYTYLTVNILPADTDNLANERYYYEIYAVNQSDATDGAGLGTGNTVGRAMGNFVKGESLGLVKQIYFYNNIVMNTGGASIQTEGNCDSVYIYNNTLIQNKNFGEGTSSEGTFKAWNWALYTNTSDGHLWIRNNAVYALISRSTNYIVKPMTNGANNFVVSNNVVYRADGSSYLVEGYTLSSSFNQNPNFTSFSGYHPPAWNLLQQATSPLNDNGFTLGSPYNLDRRGISRPQGSAYDVGAYER